MQRLDRIVSPLVERRGAHDVEHHQRRDALLVGRQLVDRPAAVVRRDRIDPFRGEVGEVVPGHGAAEPRRCREDALRDRALVEGVTAVLGDLGERSGEIGIAEDFPDLGTGARRQDTPPSLRHRAGDSRRCRPDPRRTVRSPESPVVVRDRRSEHVDKAFGAEATQQRIPAGDRAGHGHGVDARIGHIRTNVAEL